MEKVHSEKKLTFLKWLTALTLSPGILFSAGYLAIYLVTNIYLNRDFKDTIQQEVETATENLFDFSVEKLHAGISLRSVTLRNLELRPVRKQVQGNYSGSVSIPNISIEQINLCNLLFSKKCAENSTREITKQILESNHLSVFSHNQ